MKAEKSLRIGPTDVHCRRCSSDLWKSKSGSFCPTCKGKVSPVFNTNVRKVILNREEHRAEKAEKKRKKDLEREREFQVNNTVIEVACVVERVVKKVVRVKLRVGQMGGGRAPVGEDRRVIEEFAKKIPDADFSGEAEIRVAFPSGGVAPWPAGSDVLDLTKIRGFA